MLFTQQPVVAENTSRREFQHRQWRRIERAVILFGIKAAGFSVEHTRCQIQIRVRHLVIEQCQCARAVPETCRQHGDRLFERLGIGRAKIKCVEQFLVIVYAECNKLKCAAPEW